jgi:hypothetical protein
MASSIARVSEITQALRQVLDPTGRRTIDWDAKIGTVVHGGGGAVPAFAAVLNGSPPFARFTLGLGPADMASVNKIEDLVTVIIAWLRANGWKVIL